MVTASSATAVYEGVSHTIPQLVGTYPSYFEATNKLVGTGAYFVNDDVLAARKVMVIGQTVADELFGTATRSASRSPSPGCRSRWSGCSRSRARRACRTPTTWPSCRCPPYSRA